MRRLWGEDDPWATPWRSATRWLARAALVATGLLTAFVVFLFAMCGVNELRLKAIEREYAAVAKSLVARRAIRSEARAELQALRGAEAYDLDPGARDDVHAPALLANDPSDFSFVAENSHAEALLFFDIEGRAEVYRVGRAGVAL